MTTPTMSPSLLVPATPAAPADPIALLEQSERTAFVLLRLVTCACFATVALALSAAFAGAMPF